ncbi:hypothetical protein [uncultured Azohydromonas sp.]|jgi:hypothetical protein|uniref:hypothetical protein n=1 Tax=uncultured Azohydromonas sp. TaxID=487342 RepID=UPI00260E67EE|nr:hypothetical protein [uncultured Azohydromonas sp.]
MKPVPQFLPPRQSIIYAFTRRMLDETGANANSFAMALAEKYLALTAPDVRQVKFRLGEGDELIAAMRNNGQILRRYMDGTVKVLPADLEDAWLLALPQPYRDECERALAARRGLLAVRMPEGPASTMGSVAELFQGYSKLMEAVAPALADGRLGPEDRAHAPRIKQEGRRVVAAVLSLEHELDVAVYGEAEG